MVRFNSYSAAETALIDRIVNYPDFVTKTMHERLGEGFVLTDPRDNMNQRSNYTYAHEFFTWLMTGEKEISKELLALNPWVQRFVDTAGLPPSFSASYGWKIKAQLPLVFDELRKYESRRAYIKILQPGDDLILMTKTTHEYPCTIGMQLFFRYNELHAIVNMRSNNCWSVMPYDVFNFTMLHCWIAEQLGVRIGEYHHQINSAHIYNGDIRRIKNR